MTETLNRNVQVRRKGIETETGHLGSGAAAVQMLILPVVILAWGIVILIIAALT